jgi:hypothetical protein
MTELEAAWLAGLFDGEGSLNYELRAYRGDHRNQTSPGSWRVRVRMTMTHQATIDRVQALAGGGTVYTFRTASGRQAWLWECSCRLAREMLAAIEPYVITKRERVLLALEAEQVRTAASSSDRRFGVGGRGTALKDEVHHRLAELSDQIKALSEKGAAAASTVARLEAVGVSVGTRRAELTRTNL